MLQAIRSRLGRDDKGFTLIELMVVVLIIAILIAIAIPTFMGARTKAQDRATQVTLRQGLLTAKSYYTDSETYAATGAALHGLEPSVAFSETVASASQTVIGFTGTTTDVVMVRQSKSGKWFCIADSTTAGTTYGNGAALANVDTLLECAAAAW
ncbi:MAG: prepilin-type N-terminal cleavage/methylation domain-containing protein [Actinomycetota bacterium]